MAPDDSTGQLVQEFDRRLKPALQLTGLDYQKQAKRIFDLARNAGTEESQALSIPDAEDPERSKSTKGSDQRQRMDGALRYYLEALVACMQPIVHQHFKPVALAAAKLTAVGSTHADRVHGAPSYICDCARGRDWVGALHDHYGRPERKGFFEMQFQNMFEKEWFRLSCEAELEAPSELSTIEGAIDGPVSRSTKRAAGKKSRELRESVIREAARRGLEGPEYCNYIFSQGLSTSSRLQRNGCPKSYPAAYRDEKWRKSIQQEKTRIAGASPAKSTVASPGKSTIH